jgi:hypothetical protein
LEKALLPQSFQRSCRTQDIGMHVSCQKNHAMSASRVSSGRRCRRPDQVRFGKRDRRRSWTRSHAGHASCSLGAPATVRQISFSRRSSPGRMATQPASIRERRLRVSVVSSRDVSLRDLQRGSGAHGRNGRGPAVD